MKNHYPHAAPKLQPRWQKQARQGKSSAMCEASGCSSYATHRVDIQLSQTDALTKKSCDAHKYSIDLLVPANIL